MGGLCITCSTLNSGSSPPQPSVSTTAHCSSASIHAADYVQGAAGGRSGSLVGAGADFIACDPSMADAASEPFLPHLKLEQLHDVSGEDLEFEQQLFQIFKEQFAISLAKLEAALKAEDKPNAILYSHDIKGAARNIGAEEVGRVARDMEDNARVGKFKEVASALPSLNEVFTKLTEAFDKYVETQDAK